MLSKVKKYPRSFCGPNYRYKWMILRADLWEEITPEPLLEYILDYTQNQEAITTTRITLFLVQI